MGECNLVFCRQWEGISGNGSRNGSAKLVLEKKEKEREREGRARRVATNEKSTWRGHGKDRESRRGVREGREQGREEERNKRAREETGVFFGGGALSFPTHPLPSVDDYFGFVVMFWVLRFSAISPAHPTRISRRMGKRGGEGSCRFFSGCCVGRDDCLGRGGQTLQGRVSCILIVGVFPREGVAAS